MIKYVFSLMLLLSGCSAMYMNSYELFVESMDQKVALGRTLNQMIKLDGKGWASKEYLIKSELKDGFIVNFYKKPNIFGRFCYYHFIVNKSTKVIEGWNFDFEMNDPKQNCGISG